MSRHQRYDDFRCPAWEHNVHATVLTHDFMHGLLGLCAASYHGEVQLLHENYGVECPVGQSGTIVAFFVILNFLNEDVRTYT
mmetsp:Transcript_157856/g.290870  ORF Transcript_157856/g.290870 Transcript_157856/m.290870 type:complete len:82 (-) Transcript_157856:11-256(-)